MVPTAVMLLLLVLRLQAAVAGNIPNAAEEVDVPPEHRAAPPMPMQPMPAFAGFAPPPAYPLFYQAALLPFGRYSASHSIGHPHRQLLLVVPPNAA
ncbi:uncharacterized protein LOC115632586 [Scaptodrosophila lebanonensis]|uniref:Uncharacterized protein LOC115632586 n=1 Tax=Drosophila lebanonensis TaxID=7225 RepID=A0A6J2UC84_DROLE|nr:uncharacterized protein LOC115632586 [Scaptodrosophila lebanonensis]